jgi:CRP/FNR family cyclic AMP-dependent transcriptional regulator
MKPWLVSDTQIGQHLTEKDIEIFHRVCPDRRYQKGEYIFREGDPAESVHLIAKGEVKLVYSTSTGQERILAVCCPYDLIGEAFLSENSIYQADAVALTEVMICPISREQFMQMALKAPHFTLVMAEILSCKLLVCREQLGDSYAPIKLRLIRTFLALTVDHTVAQDGEWVTIEVPLNHDDFASMIGATRVSTSTAIAALRKQKVVRGTRGTYQLNIPALEALAENLELHASE